MHFIKSSHNWWTNQIIFQTFFEQLHCLEYFFFHKDWMLIHHRLAHVLTTHLYHTMERYWESKVICLAQKHNTLSSARAWRHFTLLNPDSRTIEPVLCLPFKTHTLNIHEKYSNYKTNSLNRCTLSILLPTSIFMISFLVEYISTSFSHSSNFSKVSLLLVSYTKGKRNTEE